MLISPKGESMVALPLMCARKSAYMPNENIRTKKKATAPHYTRILELHQEEHTYICSHFIHRILSSSLILLRPRRMKGGHIHCTLKRQYEWESISICGIIRMRWAFSLPQMLGFVRKFEIEAEVALWTNVSPAHSLPSMRGMYKCLRRFDFDDNRHCCH